MVNEQDRFDGMTLGTDGMFLCTFLGKLDGFCTHIELKPLFNLFVCPYDVYLFSVAFLFNWVGLLAALCVSNTVAGRFGALSGFGLSIVKWVAIVQVGFSHLTIF